MHTLHITLSVLQDIEENSHAHTNREDVGREAGEKDGRYTKSPNNCTKAIKSGSALREQNSAELRVKRPAFRLRFCNLKLSSHLRDFWVPHLIDGVRPRLRFLKTLK